MSSISSQYVILLYSDSTNSNIVSTSELVNSLAGTKKYMKFTGTGQSFIDWCNNTKHDNEVITYSFYGDTGIFPTGFGSGWLYQCIDTRYKIVTFYTVDNRMYQGFYNKDLNTITWKRNESHIYPLSIPPMSNVDVPANSDKIVNSVTFDTFPGYVSGMTFMGAILNTAASDLITMGYRVQNNALRITVVNHHTAAQTVMVGGVAFFTS